MKNLTQKTYSELLAELQNILQQVENGDNNPDQWEAQLSQVQALLAECRSRLQGTEKSIDEALTNL